VKVTFFLLILPRLDKLVTGLSLKHPGVSRMPLQTTNRQLQRGSSVTKLHQMSEELSPRAPSEQSPPAAAAERDGPWHPAPNPPPQGPPVPSARPPPGCKARAGRAPTPGLQLPRPGSARSLGCRGRSQLPKRCRGADTSCERPAALTQRSSKRTNTPTASAASPLC